MTSLKSLNSDINYPRKRYIGEGSPMYRQRERTYPESAPKNRFKKVRQVAVPLWSYTEIEEVQAYCNAHEVENWVKLEDNHTFPAYAIIPDPSQVESPLGGEGVVRIYSKTTYSIMEAKDTFLWDVVKDLRPVEVENGVEEITSETEQSDGFYAISAENFRLLTEQLYNYGLESSINGFQFISTKGL